MEDQEQESNQNPIEPESASFLKWFGIAMAAAIIVAGSTYLYHIIFPPSETLTFSYQQQTWSRDAVYHNIVARVTCRISGNDSIRREKRHKEIIDTAAKVAIVETMIEFNHSFFLNHRDEIVKRMKKHAKGHISDLLRFYLSSTSIEIIDFSITDANHTI